MAETVRRQKGDSKKARTERLAAHIRIFGRGCGKIAATAETTWLQS